VKSPQPLSFNRSNISLRHKTFPESSISNTYLKAKMKFADLLTALAIMATTALAAPALQARQDDPCIENCQNEFVECFTRTADFDGCEVIRRM
jgi:hypothetical protein